MARPRATTSKIEPRADTVKNRAKKVHPLYVIVDRTDGALNFLGQLRAVIGIGGEAPVRRLSRLPRNSKRPVAGRQPVALAQVRVV